jgi:hypothetical protein
MIMAADMGDGAAAGVPTEAVRGTLVEGAPMPAPMHEIEVRFAGWHPREHRVRCLADGRQRAAADTKPE